LLRKIELQNRKISQQNKLIRKLENKLHVSESKFKKMFNKDQLERIEKGNASKREWQMGTISNCAAIQI
jgi:hypothetical protein